MVLRIFTLVCVCAAAAAVRLLLGALRQDYYYSTSGYMVGWALTRDERRVAPRACVSAASLSLRSRREQLEGRRRLRTTVLCANHYSVRHTEGLSDGVPAAHCGRRCLLW